MRRTLAACAFFLAMSSSLRATTVDDSAQVSAAQTEVALALNVSTAITIPAGTRFVEIFNNVPAGLQGAILWCNPAGAAAIAKSIPILPQQALPLDASDVALGSLQCLSTYRQTSCVTPAPSTCGATIVTTLQ